jgi:hypothetical protein
MDKLISEELLRQIQLMGYDRSKPLLEQKPDNLMPGQPDNPSIVGRAGYEGKVTVAPTQTKGSGFKYNKSVAKKVFDKIVKEVDGGWFPIGFSGGLPYWAWGTDEKGITNSILSIENLQQYKMLFNLLLNKYGEGSIDSISNFIQQREFSTAVSGFERELWNGPGDFNPGQDYQYHFNDYYLEKIVNHLKKFNPDEKIDYRDIMSINDPIAALLPPAASEAVHTVLPLIAMAAMVFPPASAAIELVDAGLYYAEGNAYATGLGVVFCLIPGGPLFSMISKSAKPLLMSLRGYSLAEKNLLIKKMASYESGEVVEDFTQRELKLLSVIGDSTVQKLLKRALIKKGIIDAITNASSINIIVRFIYWMVKKGYLLTKFLTQMGLTIGGTFYTWDYLASVLGLCDTLNIKQLSVDKNVVLSKIGGAAEFLQRFTNPCDKKRVENEFADLYYDKYASTKLLVIKRLQLIVDTNTNLTMDRFKNIYSLETLSVQVALRNLGFTKFTEIKKGDYITTYKPVKDEFEGLTDSQIKLLQKTNTGYDPTGGLGSPRMSSQLPATGNIKTDAEQTVKMLKLPKDETKVVDVKFKWGYYDYNTSMVIKEFQKKNNLKVDGECGTATAKKIIEKVNSLSTLEPYDSKISDLDPKEIKEIERKIKDKFASEQKNPLTESDLNSPLTTEEQKTELEKDLVENTTDKIDNINLNAIDVEDIASEIDFEGY